MGSKSWSINYSEVDWSLSNAEIARLLNIDTSSVYSKRKTLGLAPATKIINKEIETLPSGAKIDWDKSIRFKDKSCQKRRKIYISCSVCGNFRYTTCLNITRMRNGYINKCKKCHKLERGRKSKLGKPGYYITSSGYVSRSLSTFPEQHQTLLRPMVDKSNRILEHRAIAAINLNRSLLKTEVVHHINGEKTDNRWQNLEVTCRSKHTQDHKKILKELKALRNENEILRAKLKGSYTLEA
jgi:DNA-directed RNA polymerase beta' subunit